MPDRSTLDDSIYQWSTALLHYTTSNLAETWGVEIFCSNTLWDAYSHSLGALVHSLVISNYNEFNSTLEDVGSSSRTAKLWLDVVVEPVLIMMKFVRAAREADWPLHLVAFKAMLPYFAAAGHWNDLRYGLAHLIKMSQLPPDLMKKSLSGKHATRHQTGWWNAIWLDMMIETTVLTLRHGPHGMIGITLKEKTLESWASNLP